MANQDKPQTDEGTWQRFLDVLAALRGEHGCPWDKEQTYESLTHYVLEEANEVVSSVLEKDSNKLQEELGDLLLEIGLYCQIAKEREDFQPADVLSGITEKLIRRHPHVFGDETILSSGEVRTRWEQIKRQEPGRYEEDHSLMDEVQKGLPALMQAQKQQVLAAGVGFDWESTEPVLQKIDEELGELERARAAGEDSAIKEEVGDLLYACVNLARKVGVDAETALLGTIGKFGRRFRHIEQEVGKRNLSMKEQSLSFLDSLWEKAKEQEGQKEG
jgi:tetrapyrrole methylase family protein/MazG family protein